MSFRTFKFLLAAICSALLVYFFYEGAEPDKKASTTIDLKETEKRDSDTPGLVDSSAMEETPTIESSPREQPSAEVSNSQSETGKADQPNPIKYISNDSEPQSASATTDPSWDSFQKVLRGLKYGHFDIETSSRVYPPHQGDVDHHSHEYDDKFNVTFADYFKLLDHKLFNIHEVVPPEARFVLILGNAKLSPNASILINSEKLPVIEYQKRVARFTGGDQKAIKTYSLDGKSGNQLTALKIGFSPDSFASDGLARSMPSCVRRNVPGKFGEYRNGALVIQAIDAEKLKINPITKTAALDAGLIWESTIFWHQSENCYR